jgi:hypothetical protein
MTDLFGRCDAHAHADTPDPGSVDDGYVTRQCAGCLGPFEAHRDDEDIYCSVSCAERDAYGGLHVDE